MKVTSYYKESLMADSAKKADAKAMKEKYGIKEQELFNLVEEAVGAHGQVGMSSSRPPCLPPHGV